MSTVTLEEVIRKYKATVDAYVDEFLPREHDIPDIQQFYYMMRDYPSRRSKGLRGALSLMTCEAFGSNWLECVVTAAGLELFQNWVLIHDDIEDESEMRRGQPVLHRKHGIPLAINAGDALHGKMWEVLLKNTVLIGESKTILVINEFSRMVNETTEGQHLELSWVRNKRWDLTEQDYFMMCERKTAWYTCISPCRLGAIIADAKHEVYEQMIPFGTHLGIAFQIRDDLLNLEGEPGRYGKEVAGDIYEGKRTIILIKLLNTCSKRDRDRIIAILNKSRSGKTEEEVFTILDKMKSNGLLDEAREVAVNHAVEARKYFEVAYKDAQGAEAKESMSKIIDYMVSRSW